MRAERTEYAIPGWGVGTLWTDGDGLVLAHELAFSNGTWPPAGSGPGVDRAAEIVARVRAVLAGGEDTLAQWEILAEALNARGLIPFIDLAYQGFGDGIEEDVAGARALLGRVPEAIVAVSGAKTFGLYRERVGALYVKTTEQARLSVASNLFALARANYSMPPDHGAACVREVLSDAGLRASWRDELDRVRAHIKRTRVALAAERVNSIPMHPIAGQKGMFSTLPLNDAQVTALREQHGIYMTDAARINVAGLRMADIPRFVYALKAVA